jgi:hypothetical protein
MSHFLLFFASRAMAATMSPITGSACIGGGRQKIYQRSTHLNSETPFKIYEEKKHV